MSGFNPQDDVSNFIEEFGTTISLKSVTRYFDNQTGDPIETFTTATIKGFIYSFSKRERIMNPTTLNENTFNLTVKGNADIGINDHVIIGGQEYVVKELMENPIFSDNLEPYNFSTALKSYMIIRKQDTA